MSMTTEQKIKTMHDQARKAEQDKADRERTERMLAALDEQVLRKRRHHKALGHGVTVQNQAEYTEAVVGLNDLEARGCGPYIKTAGVDMYGWSWIRSKELRELVMAYTYADPADSESVTKRVAGEPEPSPVTTRHAPGEVRTKSFKMRLPTPHDDTLPDRTFQAIISTADIDADGEVVVPDGMDYSRFEGNPRLLLDHDQSKPIGRVVELERVAEGWRMTATLTQRPADFVGAWLADDAWHRIQAGELAAVSVSFLPMKSHDDQDDQGRTITVHDEWELVEVSVVPVGSNPRARITGIGTGGGNRTGAAA